MTFAFHAAPPPGEWINDPNGLVFADGAYRLFVQHSADAPDFRRIGWARLSSVNLLDWRWDGVVLPSDRTGHAYSGSVDETRDGMVTWLTRHDEAAGSLRQRQVRVVSRDAGRTWTTAAGSAGTAGRNVRDPFVWCDRGGWRMLLARPCDWADWAAEAPSRLDLLTSSDGVDWTVSGRIGPWHPPGVMWEVPVAVDYGDVAALIVSLVDRRGGEAACSVRYWLGRFADDGFVPQEGWPSDGRLLDHGPDFYAAIPNTPGGWPGADRVIVGWASSWATARKVAWPEGVGGGPIALPRTLQLDRGQMRLKVAPIAAAVPRGVRRRVDGAMPIDVVAGGGGLRVRVDPRTGVLEVARNGIGAPWRHRAEGVVERCEEREVMIFVDGSLVEIFLGPEGVSVTARVPHSADGWGINELTV